MSRKLFPLLSPADREKAQPILDELKKKGFLIAGEGDQSAPALLFLSAAFAADESAQEAFFAADGAGREIIPVDLDGAAQGELVRSALMAKNAIATQGRTVEEIAARVASAEVFAQKRISKPLGRLLIAAALILVLGAGVWIWQGSAERRAYNAGKKQAVQTASRFGLSAEDLARVQSFAIIGDKVVYSEEGYATDSSIFATQSDVSGNGELFRLGDYAYHLWEEDGKHWYSTEDGHEFTITRYEDLSFLKYMPNLRSLTLLCVEADEMPSLLGLGALEQVELARCVLPDYEWLAGAHLFNFMCLSCNVSDFSPLSRCERLFSANFELGGLREADFSAFSPPQLSGLSIMGWDGLESIRLEGLSGSRLNFLDLTQLPLADLGFLSGLTTLKALSINNLPALRDLSALEGVDRLFDLGLFELPELRDISAVGGMKMLQNLTINRCPRIEDYSAIALCAELYSFRTSECYNLRDASFLKGKSKLQQIELDDCRLRDLDFLKNISANADGLNLRLSGDIGNYAGLAAQKNYQSLRLGPFEGNTQELLGYLEGARVKSLTLEGFRGLDLAALPQLGWSLRLEDCDVVDLSGLAGQTLRELELRRLPNLTSLKGLDGIGWPETFLGIELTITECPRLSDWSALENAQLSSLSIDSVYSAPEKLSPALRHLTLRRVEGLRDLHMLNSLPEGTALRELCLEGLSELHDLTPLRRLKIGYLEVPPQLEEQARELVESGIAESYGVIYTEDGRQDNDNMTLESLDELTTLPAALLGKVRDLLLVGDRIVDRERFEVNDVWNEETGRHELTLRDRASGEEEAVETGTMRDLSALSALTGLYSLEIRAQSLESLDGVQSMGELRYLSIMDCPALRDASAAFTLQGLHGLSLGRCPVESIQGVQNLGELQELYLYETALRDLSPLRALDYSAAEEAGGLRLHLGGTDCEDYAALDAIPSFVFLDLNSVPAERWPALEEGQTLRALSAHGSALTQERLEALVRAHPELEELQIPYNHEITDLSFLLEAKELRYVLVSGDMNEAIASLEGRQYGFELKIEG